MSSKPLLMKWLEEESYREIPIFIWSRTHTQKDRMNAEVLFSEVVSVPFGNVREFFTFCGESKTFAWYGKTQSDGPVLCFRDDGAYPRFRCFDHIHTDKEGMFYMYSCSSESHKYLRPFSISERLRSIITANALTWYENQKHSITRDELLILLRGA